MLIKHKTKPKPILLVQNPRLYKKEDGGGLKSPRLEKRFLYPVSWDLVEPGSSEKRERRLNNCLVGCLAEAFLSEVLGESRS